MTEEEQELFAQVSTDPTTQVENRFKLSEKRIRRMMNRINQEQQKKKPNPTIIRAIEEGITRIEVNLVSLVRESSRLLEINKSKNDGSLDRLNEILERARKDHARKEYER
ncbi:hypothetical protein DCC85_11315 [Paenibacillus sp. CAA11]|uniref:hypothetical protein n=1 Tax=Paenibacillus sp. CAA11 TaxID=1532905 RepID=UPI000D359D07|nr:hypothetical protein [Paenibacillus sp. CAA11]AWB44746.1 hypothetical protein DCC85_11315 [Paenibacillus sp. CAA11]